MWNVEKSLTVRYYGSRAYRAVAKGDAAALPFFGILAKTLKGTVRTKIETVGKNTTFLVQFDAGDDIVALLSAQS